ncbi:MAG: hypothetical protein JKY31_13475 [Rhodobacteraceae bacterium]|nr:hypothetical protein [Paracoccaceae bacterium]
MKLMGIDVADSPISVAEFKRATAQDFAVDDLFIADQLSAATEVVEAATNRPALTREVEFMLDVAEFTTWWFPCAPVIDVDLLSVLDPNGDWQDIPASDYRLITGHDEPRLQMADNVTWPDRATGSAIRVRATVGHVPEAVPRRLRQAIILLAQDWFRDARNSGEDPKEGGARLNFGVIRLMRQLKYQRPLICK